MSVSSIPSLHFIADMANAGDSSSLACGINRASRSNKTLYSLPVHCLTEADLRAENAKGVLQHFHAPANSHNRFLASLTQQERAILRDFERPAAYRAAAAREDWQSSVRPATAPCQMTTGNTGNSNPTWQQARIRHEQSGCTTMQATGGQQVASLSAQSRVPCHHKSMLVDVDLLTGSPATEHICSTQPWRVARVKTRAVPHSSYGYGEAGKRAQHQSYDYYKYYGFAGQGAKTSWASSKTKVPAVAALGHR